MIVTSGWGTLRVPARIALVYAGNQMDPAMSFHRERVRVNCRCVWKLVLQARTTTSNAEKASRFHSGNVEAALSWSHRTTEQQQQGLNGWWQMGY